MCVCVCVCVCVWLGGCVCVACGGGWERCVANTNAFCLQFLFPTQAVSTSERRAVGACPPNGSQLNFPVASVTLSLSLTLPRFQPSQSQNNMWNYITCYPFLLFLRFFFNVLLKYSDLPCCDNFCCTTK